MARVRLGELLLARGICSREQLSHAWEQKVLYGDRLGTSLLALGYVDEPTIAAALGAQFGVHGAHGGNLRVDPAAVALVPAAIAVKRLVLPHNVVDGVLYLLMVDPDQLRAIDEVTALTRLRVQPVVICEARMWSLLNEHHHAAQNLRPNPLTTPRLPTAPVPTTAADLAGADDLLSEDEFNDMYARLAQKPVDLGFGLPGETTPTATTDTFDLVDAVEAIDAAAAELPTLQPLPVDSALPQVVAEVSGVVSAETVASWQRPASRAQMKSVGLLEIDVDEAIDGLADPVRSPFSVPPTNTSQIVQTVDWSPISFTDAAERLKLIKTRDDIARVVLRAARSRFSRACLLTVYPHAFVGWQGIGEGYEQIADVVVLRDAPSVFDLVANSRAHSLGPLQRFPAHGAWVKATGKRIPKSIFVMPVLVRGQTVALLVADNGHGAEVDVDVAELLILAQHIALSFESLIEQE